MKLTILTLISIILFLTNSTLTKAEENIVLFYSDTCEYSNEVFEAIEEEELDEQVEIYMVEAGEDGFNDFLRSSLEDCDLNPDRGGYPTLYHDGECSVGAPSVIASLYELADIEFENEQKDDTDEERLTPMEMEETSEAEKQEVEPRPFYHYILMVLGPIGLIALGYSMIKKLNL